MAHSRENGSELPSGYLGRELEGGYLVEVLRQQAPSWLAQLPALLSPTEYESLNTRDHPAARDLLLLELTGALEAITATQPLVLLLEDLHWSDYSTLDWIAFVARRRTPARLLVLGTYRPAEAMMRMHPIHTVTQELKRQGYSTELHLTHLTEPDVASYITQRFDRLQAPAHLAPILCQRTTGNPFFLVTILDEFVRQGTLIQTPEGWLLQHQIEQVMFDVPESIRQLIDHQLSSLSDEEQEILGVASVAGTEFAATAVATALDYTSEAVEACCDALARRAQFIRLADVVEWPDRAVITHYRFLHDLHHAVVYERMTTSRRIRCHRQIGMCLEAGYGRQAHTIAAELAEHFVRGRDTPKAIHYLRYASENALQRSAHQEAIAHLLRCLDLIPYLSDEAEKAPQELRVQLMLGPALMATKGYAAAEVQHTYQRAHELCEQTGETGQLWPVLWGRWMVAHGRAEHQAARQLGEQMLDLAEQQQDTTLHLQARHALWSTTFYCGSLTEAYRHIQAADKLYVREQHQALSVHYGGHDPGVCYRAFATVSLWFLGYPDQANRWGRDAIEMAESMDHPLSRATALNSMALICILSGDLLAARQWAKIELDIATEHSFRYIRASATILHGWASLLLNDEEGMTQLQHGIAEVRSVGTKHLLPMYLAALVSAYGRSGQIEAAVGTLDEALDIMQTTGERLFEAELYRLQGDFFLQSAIVNEDKAIVCYQRALTIAQGQQAKAWELRAAMSLSHLWFQHGRVTEAHQLLTNVYDWFTEGFETSDLQEAKALLSVLYT